MRAASLQKGMKFDDVGSSWREHRYQYLSLRPCLIIVLRADMFAKLAINCPLQHNNLPKIISLDGKAWYPFASQD